MLCPWQIGVVSARRWSRAFRSHQGHLDRPHYYQDHRVRRGDVVILRQDDTVLIKRIYALGGDSFWTMFNATTGAVPGHRLGPRSCRGCGG